MERKQTQREDMTVTMDDFVEAMGRITPSTQKGSIVDFSKVKWEDIGGLDEVKRVSLFFLFFLFFIYSFTHTKSC
jgi:SpoVK/Ycf46/Vps4 family AAA+-type ATPase